MNFNDFTKKLDPDYIPSITESIDLEEKNVPTNPKLWSQAKALAKKKFDVYPSAYANGWAAKWYKSKGGSWKKEESVEIEEDAATQRFFKDVHAELKKVMDNKYYREFLAANDGRALDNVINHFGKTRGMRVDKTVKSIIDKYGKSRDEYVKKSFQSAARGRIADEVELEEKRDMTKVVGRKVPELSSDARDVLAHAINMSRNGVPGLDVPLATGKNAGKFNDGILISALTFLRNNSSKMTPMGKKYAKEVIKVLGESVELDESLLDALKKKLSDEGGAAGFKDLEAVAKKMGMDLTPEKLKKMPGIMQHRDGDFILEGFASDAQRRAAFASGYKAKGKKGKKEEVEVDEKKEITYLDKKRNKKNLGRKRQLTRFSAQGRRRDLNKKYDDYQARYDRPGVGMPEEVEVDEASEKQMMDMLRKEYGKINKIDPASPTYKKLTDMLDRLAKSNPRLLKKIADAKVKFVSPLAMNRVNRMKESRDDFSYLDRQAASDDRMFAAKKFMDALKKAGIKAEYSRATGRMEVEKKDLRKAQGIGKKLKVDKEGVSIDGTLGKSYKGVFDQNTNEQIDEMSAKQHYNKMVAQGKVGGQVVSPIDRKRFPNREREGMEGPYRVKRSGLIYYYDKKAGKYYDPQSDMYLDVKDVMEGTYSADSRQTGEEKPLITWMNKFEKALKSMGSSYAKVDPVEALKLYYRNVDPKRAASQLK